VPRFDENARVEIRTSSRVFAFPWKGAQSSSVGGALSRHRSAG
jgi:hypothetical protein